MPFDSFDRFLLKGSYYRTIGASRKKRAFSGKKDHFSVLQGLERPFNGVCRVFVGDGLKMGEPHPIPCKKG
jgi:hypothetical protein